MRTIVAGIDEVGYGPILGPLVVGSSIFLIENNPEEDMWFRLQNSIGKEKKGLGNRLLVTDSKKAWSRNAKINHLERTIKGFINQLNIDRATFSNIIPVINNDIIEQAQKYPWYSSLYNEYMPEISEATSKALTENLKQEEIEFIDFRCICTDVAEFNAIVKDMDNKSWAVIFPILKLINKIIGIGMFCRAKRFIIYSDRLGGRKFYSDILASVPSFNMIHSYETDKLSHYILEDNKNRELQIEFEVGADDKHLPVALASMVAKYTREKVMEHMNNYFIKLHPGLKPTAGYWTDGHRFLRDLEQMNTLQEAGISAADFVRIK
jgi:ribonuclease HII